MLDQVREILVNLEQRPAGDSRKNRRIFIGGDFPWKMYIPVIPVMPSVSGTQVVALYNGTNGGTFYTGAYTDSGWSAIKDWNNNITTTDSSTGTYDHDGVVSITTWSCASSGDYSPSGHINSISINDPQVLEYTISGSGEGLPSILATSQSLRDLHIGNLQDITNVHVFQCGALSSVNIGNCSQLQSIVFEIAGMLDNATIGVCPNLTSLSIQQTNIAAFDFTQVPTIQQLYLIGNPNLYDIVLQDMTQLKTLSTNGNVNFLSINNCPIQTIDASYSSLTALDILNTTPVSVHLNNCTLLPNIIDQIPSSVVDIAVASCGFDTANFTRFTNLTALDISSNNIALQENLILPSTVATLNLMNNPLTSFDATGLDLTGDLWINSPLTILTFGSRSNSINSISISQTNLTDLDLSIFSSAGTVYLSDNTQLSALALPPIITSLDLSSGAFTSFTQSVTASDFISIANGATPLDIDLSNSSTPSFRCRYSNIASLNLTGNPLENVAVDGTTMTQAMLDHIIDVAVTAGKSNGTLDLQCADGVVPSATGLSQITSLQAIGWTINTN